MEILSKKFKLKNNKTVTLRSIDVIDTKKYIDFKCELAESTDYMNRYIDEVDTDVERITKNIEYYHASHEQCLIGAFFGNKIVGYIGLHQVDYLRRFKHRSAIGLGVLTEMRGVGLGEILTSVAIDIAIKKGYQSMELEVVSENEVAINLYKKLGFYEIGNRNRAVIMDDGRVFDLMLMQKDL